MIPIVKYPLLSDIAPAALKEWKINNVPDEDPPKLQDSLHDSKDELQNCIRQITCSTLCWKLARADVHPKDSIDPNNERVPTQNEIYTIKDYDNKTIFYDEAQA